MSTSPEVLLPAPRFAPAAITTQPSAQAEAARAAGRAAGYAAGWAQGSAAAAVREAELRAALVAQAQAERAQLTARVEAALASLDAAAEAMRARTAPTVQEECDLLAATAIQLAEVVVGREVADDAERGRTALERALAAAPEHAEVVVRLNPEDLAVLQRTGEPADGLLAAGARRGVEIVADPGLAPGDAMADFPGGRVDARIATALERMRSSLRTAARA